jgi:hypothetical protein
MDPLMRMFIVGLSVPVVVTAIVALAVWPTSLAQWLIVVATPFVTSTLVAMVYAYRSRGALPQSRSGRRA